MSIVLGIDVGSSATKIVGFRKSGSTVELIAPQHVRANDYVTAIYGAFGKFADKNGLSIKDIKKVMMTGVGSSHVSHGLYGIDSEWVSEFDSIGRGGLYLSGLSEALVVSIGTGTAIVHARSGGEMKYLGGTGVGGGTLVGLSKLLLQAETVGHAAELADSGDLSKIDLRIKDVVTEDAVSSLSGELTLANFGNVSDVAEKEDIAAGIMNMLFETVGMIAIFAAQSVGVRDIVLTGNLTTLELCKRKFENFGGIKEKYGVNFIIPPHSAYATVIGTAIQGL